MRRFPFVSYLKNTLTKAETGKFTPESSADIMRRQCMWKVDSRKKIQMKVMSLTIAEKDIRQRYEMERFRLASASARRSLMKIAGRTAAGGREDVRGDIWCLIKQKLAFRTPFHTRSRSDLP